MPNQSDWRLTNQEAYLKGKRLNRKKYKAPRPDWDHYHCASCWAKFMETPGPEILGEGYATDGDHHWICPTCFEDFKDLFGWTIA